MQTCRCLYSSPPRRTGGDLQCCIQAVYVQFPVIPLPFMKSCCWLLKYTESSSLSIHLGILFRPHLSFLPSSRPSSLSLPFISCRDPVRHEMSFFLLVVVVVVLLFAILFFCLYLCCFFCLVTTASRRADAPAGRTRE